MQERLRGMKASLKLGSSFLIHVETTKGVNPAIGKPWEVFYELRTRFGRVWRPPTTILYIKEWTRVFWPTACVRRVKAAYEWSTPAYAGLSTRPQEGRLAIARRLERTAGPLAHTGLHDGERLRRRQHMGVAGPGVVGMAMGDDGALDHAVRVDIKAAGLDMETGGCYADPAFRTGSGHLQRMGSRARDC